MSILIKGIDMPKSCKECLFEQVHYVNNYSRRSYCVLGAEQEHCPLVEIPTPHGRLIDGDELISDLRIYESKYCGEQGYITQDDIIDAPTILEAEE